MQLTVEIGLNCNAAPPEAVYPAKAPTSTALAKICAELLRKLADEMDADGIQEKSHSLSLGEFRDGYVRTEYDPRPLVLQD